MQYKQLDHKIHPHPGCYFAVPNSKWVCFHFEVFEKWVEERGLCGATSILDVGTGCGVLSFIMLKHARLLHRQDVKIKASPLQIKIRCRPTCGLEICVAIGPQHR